ncbi:MAG: 4-hydroxythreonine-4-phosphate dehydrogenase PdxA [Candidatus Margulisiibacteriota bacterium]
MNKLPIIGITMGDPAGIGPEICAKALISGEVLSLARCVVIGDLASLKRGAKAAKISGVSFNPIQKIEDAKFARKAIDVLDLANVDQKKLAIGKVSKEAGKASVEYIEMAIDLALAKKIDAIATGPINKEAIRKAGYKYQGHTEILGSRTKSKNYAMMFVSDTLWVILVTTHLALKDVPKALKKEKIINAIKLAHQTLYRLRKKKPRIGVAGLNPHAGEHGLFGDEEIKIIQPAVAEAKKAGISVTGPLPPDSIFHLERLGKFDIVVAMYHDQGLIPLKLMSFNRSVNVTVGLPIIRTSVDHGTGFDIAGKGWAKPDSLIQAIKVASHFATSPRLAHARHPSPSLMERGRG